MSEIRWFVSGSGGSRRGAPRPASAVASRKRGEALDPLPERRVETDGRLALDLGHDRARAALDARAVAAEAPDPERDADPEVDSAPLRVSCRGRSTR